MILPEIFCRRDGTLPALCIYWSFYWRSSSELSLESQRFVDLNGFRIGDRLDVISSKICGNSSTTSGLQPSRRLRLRGSGEPSGCSSQANRRHAHSAFRLMFDLVTGPESLAVTVLV